MPFADLPGDLRLFYEDCCYADPWSNPETVILHHGIAKNSRHWYPWLPLLTPHYRVIRFDARGFGKSSIPSPGYDWSLAGFADDLAHLMDHLQINRAHIIGETLGGTIGLQFAYRYPERVRTLATLSSIARFKGIPKFFKDREAVETIGVEAWARATSLGRAPHLQPALREWYVREMGLAARHVMRDMFTYLTSVDLADILPDISAPTLVMVGKDARENTPERTTELAARVANGRCVQIPGLAEFAHIAAPRQCFEIWRDFVTSAGA